MDYHINKIFLGETLKQFTIQDAKSEASKALNKLSKINIFVGANNSGKSRFMRGLAATQILEFATHSLEQSNEIRHEFEKNFEDKLKARDIKVVNQWRATLKGILKCNFIKEGKADSQPFLDCLTEIATTKVVLTHEGARRDAEILNLIKQEAYQAQQKLMEIVTTLPKTYNFHKIYFPTLRGLRTISNQKDIYEDRTKKDYFGVISYLEVFTGLKLYEEIQSLLLGSLIERKIVAEFERFLSDKFFERKSVALIPKKNQDVLDIKIGDEKEFPIHDLGDGIQSVIILTFPLFKYRHKPVLAFFEEPEMFMHPGLQRVFLNTLTSFREHQYFLTTHSNHFLDITLDLKNVSVYTFTKELEQSDKEEKEASFKIENVSNEDSRSLELLGVRNSSVFLSNCTIWVEGITDRRYLAHYLKLYQIKLEDEAKTSKEEFRRFREDLHFSFVEYGGGNITHWSFLDNEADSILVERLCGRLFLITDRDNANAGAKKERHEKSAAKLKERYYCLKCKEIENLLTPNVIRELVKHYEGDEADFGEFAQDSYNSSGLGTFIQNNLLKGVKKRKGSYATESGTVSDKVNFCSEAILHIKSFADLSPEAQSLTMLLYDFIKAHN